METLRRTAPETGFAGANTGKWRPCPRNTRFDRPLGPRDRGFKSRNPDHLVNIWSDRMHNVTEKIKCGKKKGLTRAAGKTRKMNKSFARLFAMASTKDTGASQQYAKAEKTLPPKYQPLCTLWFV